MNYAKAADRVGMIAIFSLLLVACSREPSVVQPQEATTKMVAPVTTITIPDDSSYEVDHRHRLTYTKVCLNGIQYYVSRAYNGNWVIGSVVLEKGRTAMYCE